MLDIKFVRENPDAVKENIRKKFQDAKLPLVDEVIELDTKRRAAIAEADQLRADRNGSASRWHAEGTARRTLKCEAESCEKQSPRGSPSGDVKSTACWRGSP